MSTQEEAIKKVGEAFASGPGSGMTPEQLAAYKRVQEAFTPRSADQIIDSPQKPLQLGVVDPDTTESYRSTQSVMDATPESMLAGFEATRQRDLDTQRAEQETLQKERRDLAQQQSKVMEGFSQEELIRDERKELGVQKMIDEQMLAIQNIRGLREQYTNLEQQKGEALALSDGRVAPVGFIRGEQARIAEQFDRRQSVVSARMGAETAHMQAMSGMVQQARGLIGDIVNAATFDTELELNRIQLFRDVNAQELSELDQSIQNQLSESQRYWENRLQTERNEKTQVMEWMIQAPEAGITINDSLEVASGKVSTRIGIRNVEEVANKAMQAGASEEVVNQILQSKTVSEALSSYVRLGVNRIDGSSGDSNGEEPVDLVVKFNPTNKKELVGVGFSSEEITDLELALNQYGTKQTLEALYDDPNYSTSMVTRLATQINALEILDEIESEREPQEESESTFSRIWGAIKPFKGSGRRWFQSLFD